MQSDGRLLVDNLVPVRVSSAKAGTPTVMFGKGRLHRATFRLGMLPGAPDVEAQVRSHALFDQIRNALSSSSAVGVSGGGGAPADGGNDTAMPEVELAGPTLRTDAQRPSRFEPTENPRGRAHGSRRPNGLDEQGLKGASTGWPCSVASPSGPRRRRCTAPIALRLAGSSSRRSGSGWRTANAIGAVEGGLRSYSLLDAETLVLVNHTVRLSGLTLSQGKGGPAGRALRSEAIAAPLFYQQRHSPLD